MNINYFLTGFSQYGGGWMAIPFDNILAINTNEGVTLTYNLDSQDEPNIIDRSNQRLYSMHLI